VRRTTCLCCLKLPTTPRRQLRKMLTDVKPRFVFCSRHDADNIQQLLSDISTGAAGPGGAPRPRVYVAEDLWSSLDSMGFAPTTSGATPAHHSPSHATHAIFTSGSTGSPKAVLVQHFSLTSYCFAKIQGHSIAQNSRILLASAFVFDPNLGDVFSTLIAGATLCLADQDQVWCW